MMIGPASQPRSTLDYARAYQARGWAVVPLHGIDADGRCTCGDPHTGLAGGLSPGSKGKHPHTLFAPHGALSASKDPDVAQRWFGDGRLNIGIATGEASGIVAVDIDPRDGGDETWSHFLDLNRARVPETVIASTGGGGQHILFQFQPDTVVRTPGKGIQIKGNGGYIVVEPSRHHSGNVYSWDAEADPLDGANPAPAPAWLSSPRKADLVSARGGNAVGHLPPQRIADLRAALRHIDPDGYSEWIQVGMALHSTEAAEAFEIWLSWSAGSQKFDHNACLRKWASFTVGNGLHVESIFSWAHARGWAGETERVAVPIETVVIAGPPAKSVSFAGLGLLELPGALGDLVRWANRVAPKPQPPFAVSSALALGSVACGRRFRGMPRQNWTSLYFLNVGKSGSGKEFGRTMTERVLAEADWAELVGHGGYSSDTAVLSALEHQPVHISVIDEFGALLGNAQSEGGMHQRAAINTLIECWGNLHGTKRPKAYAMTGLPKAQADALMKRVIHQPAVTLLGMTTPGTFYGALKAGSIEGGFLGRLLITETDIGRQPLSDSSDEPIPASVIQWLHAVRAARQRLATHGNLATIDPGAGQRAIPIDVPTSSDAQRIWRAFELELIARQDELEDEGIAELDSRRLEQAMRLAVILAVSVDPDAPVISAGIAEWCVRYVRHLADQTLVAVRANMHDSKFSAWQADVLRCIRNGGEKGRTERDLCRTLRTFDGLEPRLRRSVLDALVAKGEIALVESTGASGRGRKRVAWVAIEEADE